MRLKDKKPNDRVAVALVLCFCVVAIASIFTMRSSIGRIDLGPENNINVAEEDDLPPYPQEQAVSEPVPTVDSATADPAPPQESESVPAPDSAPAPLPEPAQSGKDKSSGESAAADFMMPVNGTLVKGFSDDIPVYSITLDQFMVHPGLDIEAPKDTQVLAAAGGTVTKVYNDDKYGITIEISHGNGLVTKYANLSTNKMVEEGDVVKKGQPISGVGSSGLFESLEAPHLHFEVQKNGVPVNPDGYIK